MNICDHPLYVQYETLIAKVVREANSRTPCWVSHKSTGAGLPQVGPPWIDAGGWNTIILAFSENSDETVRNWKISESNTPRSFVLWPSKHGLSLSGVEPVVGLFSSNSQVFRHVREGDVFTKTLKYKDFLEKNGILPKHILCLVRLFVALRNNDVFKFDWIPGWTAHSLRVASELAWSLAVLPAEKEVHEIPGWILPFELRRGVFDNKKIIKNEPSGLWSNLNSIQLIEKIRGPISKNLSLNFDHACDSSVLLGALGGVPSGNPSFDWRSVGKILSLKIKSMDFHVFDDLKGFQHLISEWRRVVSKHRHNCIPHVIENLEYKDLIGDGRWDQSSLMPKIHGVRIGQEPLGNIQLRRLEMSELLSCLRIASNSPVEVDVLNRLEMLVVDLLSENSTKFTLTDRWSLLLEKLPSPRFSRRSMKKRDGGLRWLDVPESRLHQIQISIHKQLIRCFPRNGWACAFLPYRGPAWHARIHSCAKSAIVVDLSNFFGSIRPSHVAHWFGLAERPHKAGFNLFPNWTESGRKALINLIFASDEKGNSWLPQGAPTSPWVANLAASSLDFLLARGAFRQFGEGVRYSRYADDIVISTVSEIDPHKLFEFTQTILNNGGWKINSNKTRYWVKEKRNPFVACGIQVPETRGGACQLTSAFRMRARSALHHMRHLAYREESVRQEAARDRGILAFAYSATGEPGWMSYTSRALWDFVCALGGPVFAESVLAGFADSLDNG